MKKYPLDVADARKFLEPTPAVLVSTAYKGQNNIMTMGWYTIMEFTPSLLGCMITASNHTFEMLRKSKECVINLPTSELSKIITGIGNCSGADTDKFEKFGLTAIQGDIVKAPLIKECYANFECKIADGAFINKYNFFVLEIVSARAARTPKYPETIHYRGNSIFMVSGKNIRIPSKK